MAIEFIREEADTVDADTGDYQPPVSLGTIYVDYERDETGGLRIRSAEYILGDYDPDDDPPPEGVAIDCAPTEDSVRNTKN